jgi:hypothetical protein
MATVAKLNVQIGAELSGLQKSLKTASAGLESFGKKAIEIGKTMSTRLTLPIVGGFGFAVKAASDAEETFSKFATVFRDVGSEAEASFKTLRNEYGLSATASKALLSSTGDLLTGFGFAQSESLRLSTEVQKLAVDLASFTNFAGGAQGASDALTKALLGERESVKALGISILEEDVKKQMAINTSKGLTFATERQAKAQATLDIAMAQSQNAIGDYERTSGSFANQFRLLQANISDLATEFGTILLPVAQRLLAFTKRLVDGFKGLDSEAKKQVLLFAGIAAAIGPVLFVGGKIISVFGVLTKSLTQIGGVLKKVGLAFRLVLSPIFLKVAAVMALILVAKSIYDTFEPLQAFFKTLWNSVMSIFQSAINGIIRGWNKARDVIAKIVPGITESVVESFEWMDESVGGKLSEFGGNVQTNFMSVVDTIKGFVSNVTDGFDSFTKSADEASTSLDKLNKKSSELTAPTFAFSGGGIDSAEMATEGKLEVRTVDVETYANSVAYLGSKLKQVTVDTSAVNMQTEQMSVGFELLKPITDEFVNSFAQGMANVVMQGQKLQDVLKDIGKMLLSSAIQTGIKLLLSGGLSSAGKGFFGSGSGLFGSIFGVNDALIQSNGNIVKFHPDDNILAMKDFSGLGGGGGGSVKVQMVASPVRITNKEIVFAFTQGQTDWSR